MAEMNEHKRIQYLAGLISTLEKAANRFATALGKPIALPEAGKERFRYMNPDSRHIQALKAVRVVSTLNACSILLKYGLTQEMGVLFRTLHEFLTDIEFIQEAHVTGTPTSGQQEYINQFFNDDLKTTDEMMELQEKIKYVERKNVIASQARTLGQVENPEKIRRIVGALERGYSAYVHGRYPCIMELYEGNLDGGSEGFRMKGMLGTDKLSAFGWTLASFVLKALNTFSLIAHNLKMNELESELIEQRRLLEKSPAYKVR